jgi:type I restriction enzyme S subunit
LLIAAGWVIQDNADFKRHASEGVAVLLPPLHEQHAIYSKAQEELSKIDEIERTLQEGVARANALPQATLRSAFLGTLVPQCTADESASALLARISAEPPSRSSRRRS